VLVLLRFELFFASVEDKKRRPSPRNKDFLDIEKKEDIEKEEKKGCLM
jgi:hypothetical protein